MLFQPSKAMKVSVLPEQEKQLSSKDRIRMACQQENVLAFDIYSEDLLIGFAMLRQFDKGARPQISKSTLWNNCFTCPYPFYERDIQYDRNDNDL